MCTALSLRTKDAYFGRNLDIDRSYGEEVCVMPRRFPLTFRQMGELPEHYAMIGMATVMDGIPLYYDAANEYGLAMAGLNFPDNAYYAPLTKGKDNIAPFEFIPWILGQCKTVEEAKRLLSRLCLADIAFSQQIPPAPLHWMISDATQDIVAESMHSGLRIYQNTVGVLTNNPPFEDQLRNLQDFQHLRNDNAEIVRKPDSKDSFYCQGLGAVGLPGDVSSMSRFVRMSFARRHTVCASDELSSVGQFFHLLSSVEMVRGLCKTDEGAWDLTTYSACINTTQGRYYYTTYENRSISCVDLHKTDLSGNRIIRFPLTKGQRVEYQN